MSLGAGYKADKVVVDGPRGRTVFADKKKFRRLFRRERRSCKKGSDSRQACRRSSRIQPQGARTANDDVRLGLVYRPKNSAWIVLDRLDFLVDERRDNAFDYDNWRIVNNMNTNYKAGPKTQVALQYACKYVQEIDRRSRLPGLYGPHRPGSPV